MYISFGPHEGKSVELLMIKQPRYIKGVLYKENPYGRLLEMQDYVKELIEIFDEKPFIDKSCEGTGCDHPAIRLAVYRDNLQERWWCSTCDPYQQGAYAGNLQLPNNYHHALLHVQSYCNGRKDDYKEIIRTIAQAKGLPKRVGEPQAQKFFHG